MTRFTPLWQQDGEYAATEDRRLIGALWPAAAITGMSVSPQGGGMILNIAAGTAAVPAPDQTGSLLCCSDAAEQIELDRAGTGGTEHRIDLVVLALQGAELGLPGEAGFEFQSVRGVFASSPVPPAVPSGSLALAQVYVPADSVTIAPGNITDRRPSTALAVGTESGPRAKVHRSVGVTIPSGVWTPIQFDATDWDPLAMRQGNGSLRVPIAGLYRVVFAISIDANNPTQSFSALMWRNGVVGGALGSQIRNLPIATGSQMTSVGVDKVMLAAGNNLQVVAHNGGPNGIIDRRRVLGLYRHRQPLLRVLRRRHPVTREKPHELPRPVPA